MVTSSSSSFYSDLLTKKGKAAPLQNAKKGGHGVSKNKIGSRGSDKVVQVLVGTVLHLVSGEVPSLVQNIATKSLYPWEILDADGVAEALHHCDNRVTASGSLDEDTDYSAPCFNDFVGKSARLHHKAPKLPTSGEAESETCRNGHIPRYGTDNSRVYANEYNEDKYEMEAEEDGEGEDNEEDEEGEGEGEEEETQYSVTELTKPRQQLNSCERRGGWSGQCCS